MATRSRRRRTEEEAPPVKPAETVVDVEEAAAPPSIDELLAKPDPEAEWFVVHTYSGYETKVKKNLEIRIDAQGLRDQIYRIIVPTEDEVEVHGGQRRTVTRKVFPGYILVLMKMTDNAWSAVRNTQGVTGFISRRENRVAWSRCHWWKMKYGASSSAWRPKPHEFASATVKDRLYASLMGHLLILWAL